MIEERLVIGKLKELERLHQVAVELSSRIHRQAHQVLRNFGVENTRNRHHTWFEPVAGEGQGGGLKVEEAHWNVSFTEVEGEIGDEGGRKLTYLLTTTENQDSLQKRTPWSLSLYLTHQPIPKQCWLSDQEVHPILVVEANGSIPTVSEIEVFGKRLTMKDNPFNISEGIVRDLEQVAAFVEKIGILHQTSPI